jgi:hypothetical protein
LIIIVEYVYKAPTEKGLSAVADARRGGDDSSHHVIDLTRGAEKRKVQSREVGTSKHSGMLIMHSEVCSNPAVPYIIAKKSKQIRGLSIVSIR